MPATRKALVSIGMLISMALVVQGLWFVGGGLYLGFGPSQSPWYGGSDQAKTAAATFVTGGVLTLVGAGAIALAWRAHCRHRRSLASA